MSEELKPCSHCEGVGIVAYDGWSEAGAWACVQCQTCKICTESCLDISEAIAAWNHRPIEDKLQDRIDALEWLRDALETRVAKITGDIDYTRAGRIELGAILAAARAAVEVGNE